jgi:dolichol-phosphate mannosyltransferase
MNLPPPPYTTEIIVVDDNSPDGTAIQVSEYINNNSTIDKKVNLDIHLVHRQQKDGLISAILGGIDNSNGNHILVMDADFSHPPEIIQDMIKESTKDPNSLVIASRYVHGGSIVGWPFKRRIISNGASIIARKYLKVCNVKDPMSGFFLFPRQILRTITFDTKGFKMLLEMLVKLDNIPIREIPYTFVNRRSGSSKLGFQVSINYAKAVWYLYRYGQKKNENNLSIARKSVRFVSKAGRFYTVGASGLLVNYLVSNIALSNSGLMQGSTLGIICSIVSNFLLNKVWTFEDRTFGFKNTFKQFGLFGAISAVGAIIQLSLIYFFAANGYNSNIAILLSIIVASIGNFLLNKRLTFKERIWS